VKEIEKSYGRLITVGNHPTPDQHGTGERVGFFLDRAGTIWGLPVLIAGESQLLVCSPHTLPTARVTGTYPAGSNLIGTTNEPTGWRSGTGRLELVMRSPNGTVIWQPVEGALPSSPPFCEAPPFPGPSQGLEYYRLSPVSDQQLWQNTAP